MCDSETGCGEDLREDTTIQSIDLGDVPFIQVSENYSVGQSKEGLICVWNTSVSPADEHDESEVELLTDDKAKGVELHKTGHRVKEEDLFIGSRGSPPNFMITNVKQEAVDEFEAGTSCTMPPNVSDPPALGPYLPQPVTQTPKKSELQELISLPDGGRIVITKDGNVTFQPGFQTKESTLSDVKMLPKGQQYTNVGANSSGNGNRKRNIDVCSPVSAYWSKKKKTDTDFLNAPVAEELKPQMTEEGSNDVNKREKEYECTMCGQICTEEAAIRSHLQQEHEIAKFICCFCGFSKNTEKYMDQHVENKHPANIWKCQWFGCGYWSVNYSSVAGHYTSNHKSYLVEQSDRVKPGTLRDKYRDLQFRKWKRVDLASLPD